MSGTLRTLLGARSAAVVGRQAERAVLLDLAERDRPLVVAVHGIAGIGKSALLAAFAEDARAHGAAVVSLDCGGIEPTEREVDQALERAAEHAHDLVDVQLAQWTIAGKVGSRSGL